MYYNTVIVLCPYITFLLLGVFQAWVDCVGRLY